jgi:hypothetical protein
MSIPRTWTLWAHDHGTHFMNIGCRRYVEAHGLPEPIVEIILTEDPAGTYYGWLRTGRETPEMIYPHEALFTVCFPYGYKAEEAANEGRMLRFSAQRASPDSGTPQQ